MIKKILNLVSVLGILVVFAFVVVSLFGTSLLDSTERALYTAAMNIVKADRGGDGHVVLVEIDKKSLEKFGPWPWSRGMVAEVIALLNRSGARIIGLDLPLSEKSAGRGLQDIRVFREKLQTYTQGKKDDPLKSWVMENLALMEENLDDDRRLVSNVSASGNVILTAAGRVDRDAQEGLKEIDAGVYKNSLARREIPLSLVKRHATAGLALPFSELVQAAYGLGYDNPISLERRAWFSYPLYVNYKGALLPSFPLRMAIAYLRQQPGHVLVESNRIRLGDFNIPTFKGEMPIIFQDNEKSFRRVSFSDVLQKKIEFRIFKEKAVLIGLESFYFDTSSPFHQGISKTVFDAHVLNNILNRNFMGHAPWMGVLEFLVLILVGCFAAIYFPPMGQLQRIFWAGVPAVLILVSGMFMFSMLHIWIRTIYVLSCLAMIYLITSIIGLFRSKKLAGESMETNRLLGLSFQSQGLLDLAFEKFQKLPLDLETRDLFYNLGLEFERKRMINKALATYEYIAGAGPFRDVEDRIPRMRESAKSSTIGSHDGVTEGSVLADSRTEIRSKVGRYEIIEELGKGAMGLVYKSLDPKINRLLAIKTIRFSDEFDEDVIQEIKARFFSEAEIAGRLSHPAIVTIFDVGEDGDLTYMVMEYLEGNDLEKFISKKNLLPFRKVLDVVASVADALAYAHRAEVIHRDIKPANIMLLKNGGVKVTDFGIAKAISSSRTKTGVILGTPNYMSPEQIMGQKIDHRSDIFSLGVLFFQLLTGETPFHGDNLSSLLYQITQVKHPPVREYNPKIPRVCEQIIDKALAKNPKERFKNAGDMAKYVMLLASKIDRLVRKRQA